MSIIDGKAAFWAAVHQYVESCGGIVPSRPRKVHQRSVEELERTAYRFDVMGVAGAFDKIAALCGCPKWDYPGQLVRDVEQLKDERDRLRAQLGEMEDTRPCRGAKSENP